MAVSVVFGILVGTFYANHFSGNRLSIINNGSNRLNNLLRIIDDQYVDSVNIDDLVDKAIPQILAQLDPHSTYISAEDVQKVNSELKGSFSGVGIEFTIQRDTINVGNVIKGGPAEKMGLLAGDKIVEVDGKPFVGQVVTDTEARRRLMGPKGTKVEVGVVRYGTKAVKRFTITRADIVTPSIAATYMLNDSTGYIRIKSFGQKTYMEMLASLASLSQQGFSSLIIDLRDNNGGYLESAIQMADEFLPKDRLIVYTQGRKSPRRDYRSSGRGAYQTIPLVVLINEASASSAEIFAGAIQDNDRGTIVGRRSFGKGLVQQQIGFPDGSEIRLTIARYYTPSGRCIQKPYKLGDEADYDQDLLQRYERGELFSGDSIHARTPRLWRWRHHARHLRGRGHDRHHLLLQTGRHERTDPPVCLQLHRRQPPPPAYAHRGHRSGQVSAGPGPRRSVCHLRHPQRPAAAQPHDPARPLHQQPRHLQHARRAGPHGVSQPGRPRGRGRHRRHQAPRGFPQEARRGQAPPRHQRDGAQEIRGMEERKTEDKSIDYKSMEDQNIEGKDRETGALSKKSLRQHIRQRKARHTDEELVALSQPIVEAVLADPRFQEAQTVLLYHSLPDEVYTPGLIAAALRMGKRVLLPVVISRTEMEVREYLPTTEMALSDDFHILEPQGAAFTDYASVDCAIIPGMAFDAQGHRLGRGRGYYDRFLAQAADVYKVGLCFPFQLVEAVPCEATDVAMDRVECGPVQS